MLNRAFQDGRASSDLPWRRAEPFRGVDAARERFLEVDQMGRLCNACDPDFRRLVRGALLSGARYSELCRADVQDYSSAVRKFRVRQSKGGRPRWIPLDDEAAEFFEEITAGRPAQAPMFPRSDGERWGKSHQARPLLKACSAAWIDPPASFHLLRHTWASHRVMNGADLMVVARVLGHSDTRMVEKHYGHLRPSYVDDAVRASAPKLQPAEGGKLVQMR
jgi:integrase